ncbi:jg16599 [Pararge aegeria aegeria]|uniref:Jg16599 protein n=1 Tax=Pararge aegeria aegeria TaxID=348720 RepID=A0A8S4R822_9NEOP|nr:jg16599 [Pararge aegeria aegeria]
MELFSEDDINFILEQCTKSKSLNWHITEYSNTLVGYLGEHLSLIVDTDIGRNFFFVKCVPRFDQWKANYLRETSFFDKEYIMLSTLFKKFRDNDGLRIWRPKLLYIRKDLFVFEDVTQLDYTMPSNTSTLSYDEIMATVASLARFHAQSYIHEEEQSMLLCRPYSLWDDYAEYLSEPAKGVAWRETGMRAAIDFLKVYSEFRSKNDFVKLIEDRIPELFSIADDLMKPSTKYRNAVVHRDVWSNNIFFKKLENGNTHALIVDYQTVLYCVPTIDLSSMIYFNTTKKFRLENTNRMIDYYYEVLSDELELENIDKTSIINKCDFVKSYTESLVFAMTQAALIVPIIAMSADKRKEVFENPEICAKINEVSRSQEFIEIAKESKTYRIRVIELLDDLVETFLINNKQ